MTLIVGIKCTDGVVMAADGAATLGAMGTMTAVQRTVKKLRILQNRMIVGNSGSVGLSQRLGSVLDKAYADGEFKHPAMPSFERVRDKMYAVVGKELTGANLATSFVGSQVAAASAVSQTLLAVGIKDEPYLLQFDHQCSFELASHQLPFATIGNGMLIADPFLAFLRRVLWPNRTPSLAEGVLAAMWTLIHAIEIHPGGVAYPIQVALLERGGKDGREWIASELDENHVREHSEAIGNVESQVKTACANLGRATGDAKATAAPPPPP